MKQNVGSADRAIRVIGGLVLVLLAATGVISAWGWLGLIPVATGIIRFCPAYTLLGIRTCSLNTGRPPADER
ncbi:DUF2892 domain-containing protein [Uliginosibacterium paludis]|uniref:DUF2892 domain-containing protein n=1 Tax=Uliginosibacterium paludis TaxID=1615952 RepID=A0ABV2CQK2_9RHOO